MSHWRSSTNSKRFRKYNRNKPARPSSKPRPKSSAKSKVAVIETPLEQVIVPYDENFLEHAHTQWQFGDWLSLARLTHETLQRHPDRAKLALLAAAGCLQTGKKEAKLFIRLAQDWGISKKSISQILIAGVHNSLGRTAAINNMQYRAQQHFESAIVIGTPGSVYKLLIQARINEQYRQLGLGLDITENYLKPDFNKTADEKYTKKIPSKFRGFSSATYWEDRYKKGGTSGYGSYGRLADFKAHIINKFIKDENITHLIELGCGDGNQLALLHIDNYIGVDVSLTIIKKCKEKFKNDSTKIFYTNEEYRNLALSAELTLSLDVLFHLIEDEVFENYIRLLFNASNKYCIIYGCDDKLRDDSAVHVRHRTFTDWIEENINNWCLTQVIYNNYPHDGSKNPKYLSFSNFYIYKRV